jgi:hypothetical protein
MEIGSSNSSTFTVGDGGRSWRKVASGENESTNRSGETEDSRGAKKGWRANSGPGSRNDDRREYRRDDRRDADRREERREDRRDDRRKDTRIDSTRDRDRDRDRDGDRESSRRESRDGRQSGAAEKRGVRESDEPSKQSASGAKGQEAQTGSLVDDNFRMAQMLKERLNPYDGLFVCLFACLLVCLFVLCCLFWICLVLCLLCLIL